MRKRALFLLALWLWPLLSLPAAAQEPERPPLLLVASVTAGVDMWEKGRGGLWQTLQRDGYAAGKTLFRWWPEPRDGSIPLLAKDLAREVEAIHQRTGRPVDILAYSTGGLVARWFLEHDARPGWVGRVIFLAVPQEGSFGAERLFVAAWGQKLARDVAAQMPRALARAAALLPETPANRKKRLWREAKEGLEEGWEGLFRRAALHLWLDDMALFLVREKLGPAKGKGVTYRQYLEGDPQILEPLWSLPGGEGDDLAPGYVLWLALQAVEPAAAIAQGLAESKPPAPDLMTLLTGAAEGLGNGSLWGALWSSLKAWLGQWAQEALKRLGRPVLGIGARWGAAEAARRWWSLSAESPILREVLPQETAHPFEEGKVLEGNRFLRRWNQKALPFPEGVYAVTVAGETWDIIPGTPPGPHDGLVAVAATRLPREKEQAFYRLEGALSATHFHLPWSPKLRALLRDLLKVPLPSVAGRPQPKGGGVPPPAGLPVPLPQGDEDRGEDDGLPLIRVVLRTKETTHWKDDGPVHRVWIWDFGDGTREEAVGGAFAAMEGVHRYRAPGHYVVQAEARDTEDRLIRRVTFEVEVREAGEEHRFPVVSALRPEVNLELSGPRTWVIQQPATYRLKAVLAPPPFGEVTEVLYDPGEAFKVVWTRPGPGFPVVGAVRVWVTYRFPEGTEYRARHTFLVRQEVEVFAPGLGGGF
ncbi:MAG: hypothetical protein KM310_06155 [Clostridiales bacterium]|nr:hypothetical protein [Clostridiales bacterium]